MKEKKTEIRIFTIADYVEEEEWLRKQSNEGWKLVKHIPPCIYKFERTEPEDVIYRLDYKHSKAEPGYKEMFQDYGWEPCGECIGWYYFRKPASKVESENDGEIFSDNASRCGMIEHILKTRMLPLLVIFLCCVVPQFHRSVTGTGDTSVTIVMGCLFLLYVYLFAHCGTKLIKRKNELERSERG